MCDVTRLLITLTRWKELNTITSFSEAIFRTLHILNGMQEYVASLAICLLCTQARCPSIELEFQSKTKQSTDIK
jgi:hypothetical protein